MKRISLPFCLLSLASCLFTLRVSGQSDDAGRFRRPLAEVLAGVEERFGVRIDCRKFSPDTLRLDFAEMRLRPWSVTETLDNVTRPFDLKWSHRGGNRYRIEPYEYYRRTPEEGRRMLEWLSAKYADRESWERRRGAVLREARERLDMQPLYDSLAADPRVYLGELRRFDGYTTQGYALETLPGVFVCGTVYAPAGGRGRRPLIVSPAGHWSGGRLRPDQQYRMATFARMGAVAVDLDIVGWGDGARTVPFPHEDPRSMRLQALWSKAVTDWMVASRPEIDTTRMAATGGSGGATHVLLLALQVPGAGAGGASGRPFRRRMPLRKRRSAVDRCRGQLHPRVAGGGRCAESAVSGERRRRLDRFVARVGVSLSATDLGFLRRGGEGAERASARRAARLRREQAPGGLRVFRPRAGARPRSGGREPGDAAGGERPAQLPRRSGGAGRASGEIRRMEKIIL